MSDSTPPSSSPARVVCLDASTPRAVIAVGRDNTFDAGEEIGEKPNQASALLVPRIQAVLTACGATGEPLQFVGCGRGPGTFTGTRVAVATAMGLAVGAGCPVIEIGTLAAVAASTDVDGEVLALLDARRGEVYGARHGRRHGRPHVWQQVA